MSNDILWSPSRKRVERTQIYRFCTTLEEKYDLRFGDYQKLHRWSVENAEAFWAELFSFFSIDYRGGLRPACTDSGFGDYGWFPGIRFNFAHNLLLRGRKDSTALNCVHESGLKREVTYGELTELVGKLQHSLRSFVGQGDVLACYMPNVAETVVSMLATSSLGAVFTSVSCDFGAQGAIDRLDQVSPKVLVAACGYEYNGKYFDNLDDIRNIQSRVGSIEKVVVVDFLSRRPDISSIPRAELWEDFLDSTHRGPDFTDYSFSHPLYIMYSSGTTGKPKCIVHSQGGTLLQHIKELGLHSGLDENKHIFFFTTCGWMMWNWLVSSLFFGSKITLFEGSPTAKGLDDYMSMIDRERIQIFGTSPKFLRSLKEKVGSPSGELASLETILSTGAPLLPEQFDYVYGCVKKDVHLMSISGGTDIIGCFALGNPMASVERGKIQCLGLGMDVDCFDEGGSSLMGAKGELVCKKSFPSRPLYFANDPDHRRFHKTYLGRYKNIWYHGDFIKIDSDGSVQIYGRSDATLNPGGIRIGTAEIYGQLEMLPYIADFLCAGKKKKGDVDIYLFVKMVVGEELDEAKVEEIKSIIRRNTTPRHVPKKIFPVEDIPYTRSGKKMELAVTNIINGRAITNIESVANPECLDTYRTLG